MKKLMKNKKVLVALVLALAVALGGFTYAWFTANTPAATAGVESGRLRLSANRFVEWYEIDPENDWERVGGAIRVYYNGEGRIVDANGAVVDLSHYLDPGKEYELSGPWLEPGQIVQPMYDALIGVELTNPNPDGLGLAETVKIDNTVTNIEIHSDIDPVTGNAIKLDTPLYFADMQALANAYADVSVNDLGYELDPGVVRNKMYTIGGEVVGMLLWSYDKTAYDKTGEYVYYASISALPQGYNLTLDIISHVVMAPSAGNRFQGCVMDVTYKYDATQPIAEAIMAKWGGDLNLQAVNGPPEIVPLDSTSGSFARSFNIEKFEGVHIAQADAARMTVAELAELFFPDLF